MPLGCIRVLVGRFVIINSVRRQVLTNRWYGLKSTTNCGLQFSRLPHLCCKRSILFSVKDPIQVVSLQGPHLEAHAIHSTGSASATDAPVLSSTSATYATVLTPDTNVLPCPNPSQNGRETGTRGGIMGGPNPIPLIEESKGYMGPLPTPLRSIFLKVFYGITPTVTLFPSCVQT